MGVYEDLENPDLFKENAPGAYTYSESAYGKSACGQLTLSSSPQRDAAAQRNAGGESRRGAGNQYGVDDGGHLIGARFDGAPGEENLTPQDRNLNRGEYKSIENSWAEHLEARDKVYVNMESYTADGSDRPTCYMGYAIIEHTDENGNTTREVEYYSLNNESRAEQEQWAQDEAQFYADHPETVEDEMQSNTSMPYIWDEDKEEAVENPYFDPQSQDQPAMAEENPYASGDDALEESGGAEAVNSYAPQGEQSGEMGTSEYSAGAQTGSSQSAGGSDYTSGAEQDID